MSRVTITPPPEQGTGTVTSVGLTMPTGFNVANTPVTGAGTLVVTLDTLDASKISGGTFATTEAIFTTDNAAKVPVKFRGVVSQSGNLTEWQNDTPTTLSFVDNLGHLSIGPTATPNSSISVTEAWGNYTGAHDGVKSNSTITLTASSPVGNYRAFLANPTLNHATFNFAAAVIGFQSAITIAGTSGTVNTATGLQTGVTVTTGGTVVTVAACILVSPTNSGGGSVTTAIGLDIQAVTIGGTNNYAVRSGAGDWDINTAGTALANFRIRSDNDAANFYSDSVNDRDGFGTASPETKMHGWITDAATATVTDVLKLTHDSTGTPAANFGTGIVTAGESSTTSNQLMGRLSWLWTTATHASRKARGILSAYDTAERTCISWEASGTAPMVGFFGTAPVIQQTGGADTAGVLYTATEQGMLQRVYDAVRAVGIMN